jgi:hypothetical protein
MTATNVYMGPSAKHSLTTSMPTIPTTAARLHPRRADPVGTNDLQGGLIAASTMNPPPGVPL